MKAASASLAALLRACSGGGALPARIRESANRQASDEIARLVLDGILEVEHGGAYTSGARATHLLPARPECPAGGDDAVTRLSSDALRYGATLEIDDPAILSARMYFYNRQPVTPRWAHRLRDSEATARFLGLRSGAARQAALEREWAPARAGEGQGWFTWLPRAGRREVAIDSPTYKLYVSPKCDALPDVLDIVIRVLAEQEPTVFKVGSNLNGLLRPDKLVVYFDTEVRLVAVADRLHGALDGMPAHGVPFTRAIDRDGLLSRGMDPPRAAKLLSWRETESWRLWVTNRLAVYMNTARMTRDSVATSVTDFAIGRLRLDGIDTDTWSPMAAIWDRGSAVS